MARVFLYIMIMVTLTIMFQIFGFLVQPDIGITNNFGITYSEEDGLGWGSQGSSFWSRISTLLIAATATGIIIGFLTKAQTENYIVLGIMAAVFFAFVGTFDTMLNFFENQAVWIQVSAALIIIPMAIGYMITMIEYFRGNV